jgi:hypothetical protein
MRGGAIADPAPQAKGRQVASRSVVLSLLSRIGSREMRSGVAQDDYTVTCVQAECIGLHNGKRAPVVGSHDEFRKRRRVAVTGALHVAIAHQQFAPGILPGWRSDFPHRENGAVARRGWLTGGV